MKMNMKMKSRSRPSQAAVEERAGAAEGRRTDPGLRLERGVDGRLWVLLEDERCPVRVRPLFPWSQEGEHVSLRDRENRELALVDDPAALDGASQAALHEALASATFVLEVRRVLEIEEEVEIRVWRVETCQGPRTFQTRLDDWPRQLPGGGLLIRDVAGDLYHVPHPESLDTGSREELWAFVD